MKVDSQLVAHVARLAHLKFSDEEAAYYQQQLEKVLGYVEQLDELTGDAQSAIRTAKQAPDLSSAERPDEVIAGSGPEAAVSQAPEKSGAYFSVPRIIE